MIFLGKNHYEDDKMRISPSKSAPNFENALFLSAHHKFVLALILMKIWDFSYFLCAKTVGILPQWAYHPSLVLTPLLQCLGKKLDFFSIYLIKWVFLAMGFEL